jgi:hypothetical protein
VIEITVVIPSRRATAATLTTGGAIGATVAARNAIARAVGGDAAFADSASSPQTAYVVLAAGGYAAGGVFETAAADLSAGVDDHERAERERARKECELHNDLLI